MINQILSRNKCRTIKIVSEDIKILGINYLKVNAALDDVLNIAFEASQRQRNENLKLFTKLQIKKTTYCSKSYVRATSSISYCVEYGEDIIKLV